VNDAVDEGDLLCLVRADVDQILEFRCARSEDLKVTDDEVPPIVDGERPIGILRAAQAGAAGILCGDGAGLLEAAGDRLAALVEAVEENDRRGIVGNIVRRVADGPPWVVA
jgi:hypothetical protein